MKTPNLTNVLVTPARNEEDFIELAIQSVVKQTIRPKKYVIVSDGSTDRTDEIARKYAAQHDWIEFVRMGERTERDFAGKVGCFTAGYKRLKEVEYDIVGSMDADLSFDEDYFKYLLEKFAADPRLGLAGTPFSEEGRTYDFRFSSTDHVSGACQLFRRKCYEDIGGYTPVKGGGIDVIAVLSARVKGWRTQTFTEKTCLHHRPMGTADRRSKLTANFKLGRRGYTLGVSPVWHVFRSVYQMTRPPYVLAGGALLLGYFAAMIKRVPRAVSQELIDFQRKEQMKRLRQFFKLAPKDPTPATRN